MATTRSIHPPLSFGADFAADFSQQALVSITDSLSSKYGTRVLYMVDVARKHTMSPSLIKDPTRFVK